MMNVFLYSVLTTYTHKLLKRYWKIIKYTFVMHTEVAASNARMEMYRVP